MKQVKFTVEEVQEINGMTSTSAKNGRELRAGRDAAITLLSY